MTTPRGSVDTHGATFFDIDQDGDVDLLQASGGELGTASDPNNERTWNQVHLNDDGDLQTDNSAASFGIVYALGRKRLIVPINLDGEIGLYVGVRQREDGAYPGQLFVRDASGDYRPGALAGRELTGQLAKGVHFGTDDFVDVVNLNRNGEAVAFMNGGQGFRNGTRLSGGVDDILTGDFDGDLRQDVLLGKSGKDALFRQVQGSWQEAGAGALVQRSRSADPVLVDGDFDNDGDLDYVALLRRDGLYVYTYVNRGDGTFQEGPRYVDNTVAGGGAHMISGDFNRDGSLDLLITTSPETSKPGVYVYLEGEAPTRNWLSVELRGVEAETGGLGARVYVTTSNGRTRMLEQDSGAHFGAQNSTDLHFGLGGSSRANVRIVWPDGHSDTFAGVVANQHVVLTERGDLRSEAVAEGPSRKALVRGSGKDDRIIDQDDEGRFDGASVHHARSGAGGGDVLVVGRGKDRVTGGPGSDVFVFADPDQSLLNSRRDVIDDFLRGEDRIDLSRMDGDAAAPGRQTLVFVGPEPFSGRARDLRFADELLEADVGGDGVADLQARLGGVEALIASDFLL